MKRNLAVTALVAVLMGGFVLLYWQLGGGPGAVPAVTGYSEGAVVRFLHTEAWIRTWPGRWPR